jgi:hypothetical protein
MSEIHMKWTAYRRNILDSLAWRYAECVVFWLPLSLWR